MSGREGGCACGFVRYRLRSEPIIVNCCHCTWCQRESGSAFAVNAIIETDRVELIGPEPERIDTPSASGRGQAIMRCPHCKVAVWSHYAGAGSTTAFIRAGTLDQPGACPPDVHIFTESKQAWVQIPEQAERFAQFYAPADWQRLCGEDRVSRLKVLWFG